MCIVSQTYILETSALLGFILSGKTFVEAKSCSSLSSVAGTSARTVLSRNDCCERKCHSFLCWRSHVDEMASQHAQRTVPTLFLSVFSRSFICLSSFHCVCLFLRYIYISFVCFYLLPIFSFVLLSFFILSFLLLSQTTCKLISLYHTLLTISLKGILRLRKTTVLSMCF